MSDRPSGGQAAKHPPLELTLEVTALAVQEPKRWDQLLPAALSQALGHPISRRDLKAVLPELEVSIWTDDTWQSLHPTERLTVGKHRLRIVDPNQKLARLGRVEGTPSLEFDSVRMRRPFSPQDTTMGIVNGAVTAPAPASVVLFENSALLALNKPRGLSSAPLPKLASQAPTAVDLALTHCPELKLAFPKSYEPGLLHRLDRDTSGVLLFAKTPATFEALRAAWKSPEVAKFYRAVVTSSLATPMGLTSLPIEIETPLVRDPKSSKRVLVFDPNHFSLRHETQLPAHTRLLALTPLVTSGLSSQVGVGALFEARVQIYTGVMHQIRVHLSSIGLPIVGDPLYGESHAAGHTTPSPTRTMPTPQPNDPRATRAPLQLHAEAIQLSGAVAHALNLELIDGKFTVTSPTPPDWLGTPNENRL